MKTVQTKREREKRMVTEMIKLYCKKQHHTKGGALCPNCKVHCYKLVMREKIRAVMRFSGPRMLLHHPVWAIRHVVESKSEKKKLEGQT